MPSINDLTTAELLSGFNALTGQNVKRFTSRSVGIERVAKAGTSLGKTEEDFIALVRPDLIAADVAAQNEEDEDLPEVVVDEDEDSDEPVLVKEGGDFGAVAIPAPGDKPAPAPKKTRKTAAAGEIKMPRAGSKKANVLDAALREEGVTDYELKVITGWPSAKATMYRVLRQAGYGYESFKRESGETAWRAVLAA